MLNEGPNKNDVTRVASIVLNEVPKSSDATRVVNNVRLNVMGTKIPNAGYNHSHYSEKPGYQR